MDVGRELEVWLRDQAKERQTAAASRRGYARAGMEATDESKMVCHRIAEKMLGRTIPKTTKAEDISSARIQEIIADKLDQEAEMLIRFADHIAHVNTKEKEDAAAKI